MSRRKKQQDNEETIIDLVDARESAQDYFERNKTFVLAAVGGLILIVGGFLFYNLFIQAPKENSAEAAMYQAEEQFARDSFALALENPGQGFEGFLDIIDNYSGTKSANLAHYYSGISYLNLGRYDVAVAYLEDFSPGGVITPIMKYGALGDAYSELGEMDKALLYYQKAGNYDNSFLAPYYLMKYGLLSEKQGDSSSAKTAFEKIQQKYPDSREGLEIDKYIAKYQ